MSSEAIRLFNKNIAGQHGEIYDVLPFIESSGDFKSVKGIDVVINSIRTLLLTPLGNYPFDPTHGSILYKQIFELGDKITKDIIEYEVSERVAQTDDRVKVTNVELKHFADQKSVEVIIDIDRKGIKGKVSLWLPGPSGEYAFEDIDET